MSNQTKETMPEADVAQDISKKAPEEESVGSIPPMPESVRKGVISLKHPLLSRGQEVAEIHYDFPALTTDELIRCLDEDKNPAGYMGISNKQGFLLFCYAAGKAERRLSGLDRKDIGERIHMEDAVAGIKVATLFFLCASREAETRIRKTFST